MYSSAFFLAVFAGTCASLASVSSKLALEEGGKTLRYVVPCSRLSDHSCTNVGPRFVVVFYYHDGIRSFLSIFCLCLQVLIVVRSLFVILMLLFNALMWNTFVKALQKSRSTVEATVVNSASNFFCTVSFNETTSIYHILDS